MKIGLFLGSFLFFSIFSSLQAQNDLEAVYSKNKVSEKPYLLSCEDESNALRKACSTEKLAQFIADNLIYPFQPLVAHLERTIKVKLVVELDGTISDAKVIGPQNSDLCKAAIHVVNQMNTQGIRWSPGKRKGKAVRTSMAILVDFKIPEGEKVHTNPEEKSAFPGCASIKDGEDRKICINRGYNRFFFTHKKYPNEAQQVKARGVSAVQFIVEKDGTLSYIHATSSLGYGLEEEAERLIALMNEQDIRLTPARHRGQIVRSVVKRYIPFSNVSKKKQTQKESPKKIVEEMPRFPGCEEVEEEKRTLCSQKKMLTYLYGNLRYPKIAKENRVEGTVIIKYTITKEGNLEDPVLLRDIGAGCGQEALRLFKLMQKEVRWIPGKDKGELVAVSYTLPVKFHLE